MAEGLHYITNSSIPPAGHFGGWLGFNREETTMNDRDKLRGPYTTVGTRVFSDGIAIAQCHQVTGLVWVSDEKLAEEMAERIRTALADHDRIRDAVVKLRDKAEKEIETSAHVSIPGCSPVVWVACARGRRDAFQTVLDLIDGKEA